MNKPTLGLLMSMAIRSDHGLGVPGYYDQPIFNSSGITHRERLQATIDLMGAIWEEVVGQGFYSPDKERDYANRAEAAGVKASGPVMSGAPVDADIAAVEGGFEAVLRVEILSEVLENVEKFREILVERILDSPATTDIEVMVTVHGADVLPVFETNQQPRAADDSAKLQNLVQSIGEFQDWQNKARERGWHLPGNSPLPNSAWINYWRACEAHERDPVNHGRPVVPHRSGR